MKNLWLVTLAAAAMLMVTMGTRQSLGLFVSPLNTTTGLGVVTISFALAVAQFAWGAIQALGGMGAMWSLAVIALAALPLIRFVTRGAAPPKPAAHHERLWPSVRNAFADGSYILLHLGFFTCGFHIAFLVTHLPQEVNLCGLPPTVASWSLAIIGLSNIAGSLLAGAATARYRSKMILAAMYGSRAPFIAPYLLAPKA